jgi:sterol desaturase/sphingolipid hydroxylase (fatty acid hydroxylase superfamily)
MYGHEFESAGVDQLLQLRLILPVAFLALLWCWETWRPFFGWKAGRWRHAARNLAVAILNTVVLALTLGSLTVLVAAWTTRNEFGLLNALPLPGWLGLLAGLVFLDGWMYVWHRANHAIPLLWRFHRMHHSDDRMDVTTATRFHLGEHAGSAVLRLALIPVLGLGVWHILVYEILVLAITQFHHADIALGRWDRGLRLLIVTPDMHKVHHSRWRPETDSNYSTVLSLWDRLARTFRMRAAPRTLELGLSEFDDARWQTVWGMLKTPFISSRRVSGQPLHDEPLEDRKTSSGAGSLLSR